MRRARNALPKIGRAIDDRIELDLRRAVGFSLIALIALAVGHELNREHPTMDRFRWASYGCALAVLVFGALAARSTANEIGKKIAARAGRAAAAPLRVLVQAVGYLIVLLAAFDVIGIDLSQFLVGGAVTGVVLGIAAQQALGNFFAGLVLLIARPYVAGDEVTVWSGTINGPHVGRVVEVGLLYTALQCDADLLKIPNGVLLASGISRGQSTRVTTVDSAIEPSAHQEDDGGH